MLRHVDPRRPVGAAYRAYVRIIDTRFVRWLSRRVGWKLDPYLMRWSGGRVGVGLMLPTALLETTGARSGQLRRNVVLYFHDGEHPIIVASHLGAPTHPSWLHNLVADPGVHLGGEAFTAEVVEDEAERDRLWRLADGVFPPFERYRRQASDADRSIPLIRLSPAGDQRARP